MKWFQLSSVVLTIVLLLYGCGPSVPNFSYPASGSSSSSTSSDKLPPTISITSPTNNQEVGSTLTFSGTSSDDWTGVMYVYVALDSGTFIAAKLTGYDWTTNISIATMGEHILYAYAVDWTGKISTTNSVTVVRANIPSVLISAQQPGDQ